MEGVGLKKGRDEIGERMVLELVRLSGSAWALAVRRMATDDVLSDRRPENNQMVIPGGGQFNRVTRLLNPDHATVNAARTNAVRIARFGDISLTREAISATIGGLRVRIYSTLPLPID